MIMLVPDPATFAVFETWLGTPLPADPWKALRILRKQAAQEVERLLAFLDATDGNPDLEDDDREADDTDAEPSLGWTEKIVAMADFHSWSGWGGNWHHVRAGARPMRAAGLADAWAHRLTSQERRCIAFLRRHVGNADGRRGLPLRQASPASGLLS